MSGKGASSRGLSPNVFEAFRRVVYSVGVDKLAPLMGLRAGTLYNKADADDHSHNQPTLRDLVVVTQISGDLSILDELEAMFGRAAYDCAQHQGVSDEALLDLLAGQEQQPHQIVPQLLGRSEAPKSPPGLLLVHLEAEGPQVSEGRSADVQGR